MIVGGIPMLMRAVVPIDISYPSSPLGSSSTLTTYTFSGVSLGAADVNRKIAVTIGGHRAASGRTIVSCTIGGVSAVELVFVAAVAGSNTVLQSVWIASVPTGTTGNIVVTFSNTMDRIGVDVIRLIGANSTAYHTATDDEADGGFAVTANINAVSGGCVIGVTCTSNSGRTVIWTNLTERSDRVVGSSTAVSMASDATTSTGSVTVTATASGSNSNGMGLALVSLAPE